MKISKFPTTFCAEENGGQTTNHSARPELAPNAGTASFLRRQAFAIFRRFFSSAHPSLLQKHQGQPVCLSLPLSYQPFYCLEKEREGSSLFPRGQRLASVSPAFPYLLKSSRSSEKSTRESRGPKTNCAERKKRHPKVFLAVSNVSSRRWTLRKMIPTKRIKKEKTQETRKKKDRTPHSVRRTLAVCASQRVYTYSTRMKTCRANTRKSPYSLCMQEHIYREVGTDIQVCCLSPTPVYVNLQNQACIRQYVESVRVVYEEYPRGGRSRGIPPSTSSYVYLSK